MRFLLLGIVSAQIFIVPGAKRIAEEDAARRARSRAEIRVSQEVEGFTANATATEENTAPTGDIRVYQVRFPDGTAVTVMGSKAVPLIRFLANLPRDNKQIALDVRKRELQKIER